MCSAAPSIGKGPSIQRPLSGHSGHGRTRCWPAPVAIDPERTYTCIGGCHIASVQKIGGRLSFWDPGLAHAFIRALAPGEIGRIVGRWA